TREWLSRIRAVQVAGIALVVGLALYVVLPAPILRPDAASDVAITHRPPNRPAPADGAAGRGCAPAPPRARAPPARRAPERGEGGHDVGAERAERRTARRRTAHRPRPGRERAGADRPAHPLRGSPNGRTSRSLVDDRLRGDSQLRLPEVHSRAGPERVPAGR